jgi:iron-sulfur cluster assembly protein
MTIHVTNRAREKALELASREGEGKLLRMGVRGGGCSGFTYFLEFVGKVRESDHVFEFAALRVVVDPKSLALIDGTELDYERGPWQGGFRFNNPKAKKSCGCGESFAV